jgi:membrane protein YqaA with SNARE-associated domain
MEIDSRVTKVGKVNHYWKKYGIFALFIILGVIGSIFLVERINLFLKGWEQYGYLGVFLSALATNATVVWPAPFIGFVLPLSVSLASQTNLFSVAVVYALGATLGEGVGYILGRGGKRILNKDDGLLYHRAEKWLKIYGKWAIVGLSFQPILPFDIVGIVAGALRYPWWEFLIFCFLGRIPKYLLMIGFGFELWQIFT